MAHCLLDIHCPWVSKTMHIFITCVLLLVSSYGLHDVVASVLEPIIENVVHVQTALPPPDVPGIWRKKLIWKARWVQEWKSSKTYRPVWRKVWSPVEIREWLPVPRPPPQHAPDQPPSVGIEYLPDAPHAPPGPTVGPINPPALPDQPSPSRPHEPPPFRPVPPANKYGPPPAGSTPLKPVTNPPPSWSAPDMQSLLSSYHTIRDPDVDAFNEEQNHLERIPVNYHANLDSNSPSEYFEPPKLPQNNQQYRPSENSLSSQDLTPRDSHSVSPYAAKLADAVIREKLKKAAGERPPGLTDIIYRTSSSTTTPSSVAASDSPSNVYVVTPVSFG